MTWATWPIAAWAAAVAIPALLILYFLKLRRRDLEVSTTLLWKKAIQDLQANAPFQRLRRNILLLLQLLALAAILAALGQPELKANTGVGRRHVILIDRSASMNATDGDPAIPGSMTRLEAAKKAAREFVDSLPEPGFFTDLESGDQAMVIAFDTAADRRQVFTSSKSELKRAIDSIEPTDGPSSIQDALKVAKAYSPRVFMEDKGFIGRGAPLTLHLFSDGRLPDSARLAPTPQELEASEITPDDEVVYHAIGDRGAPNIGITGLRAERAFDNPGRLTLFVGLQNASLQARRPDVELSIDGKVVRVTSVNLAAATAGRPTLPLASPAPPAAPPAGAGGADGTPETSGGPIDPATGGVVFTLDQPQGGVAVVRLLNHQPDALPTDDIAYVVLPPARRLSVALVTTGNLFLQEALEGMNLSRRVRMAPAVFERLLAGQTVDGLALGDFDVVILDRWLPSPSARTPAAPGGAGAGGSVLPPGRILVLGACPPPPLGLVDEGPSDQVPVILDWVREHPALKYAGLGEVNLARGRKVRALPETPVQVLARSSDGPVVIEAASDATRAIIVPFDPADSDWPLRPGFVLFLASSLTYLAQDAVFAGAGSGVADVLRPGHTLVQRLPLGADNVRLTLPNNEREGLVPAPDGRIAFGPLRRIGFYTVSWDGPALPTDAVVEGRPRRVVAVNLLDPDESVIATRPQLDLPGRVVAAADPSAKQGMRKLWPWLVLGALGIIMLEWFVYNRKVHV